MWLLSLSGPEEAVEAIWRKQDSLEDVDCGDTDSVAVAVVVEEHASGHRRGSGSMARASNTWKDRESLFGRGRC